MKRKEAVSSSAVKNTASYSELQSIGSMIDLPIRHCGVHRE